MSLAILQYDSASRMVKGVMRPSAKRLALLEKDGVALEDFAKAEKMAAGADAVLVVEDEDALGLKDIPYHRWQIGEGGAIVVAPKPAELAKQRAALQSRLKEIHAAAFEARRLDLDPAEQAEADALKAKLKTIDAMAASARAPSVAVKADAAP